MKVQNVNNQQSFNANIKILSFKTGEGGKLVRTVKDFITSPEQDRAILDAINDCNPRYKAVDEVDTEQTWSLQNALEVITGIQLKTGKPTKFLAIGQYRPGSFCLRFGDIGKNDGDVIYSVYGKEFAQELENALGTKPQSAFEAVG